MVSGVTGDHQAAVPELLDGVPIGGRRHCEGREALRKQIVLAVSLALEDHESVTTRHVQDHLELLSLRALEPARPAAGEDDLVLALVEAGCGLRNHLGRERQLRWSPPIKILGQCTHGLRIGDKDVVDLVHERFRGIDPALQRGLPQRRRDANAFTPSDQFEGPLDLVVGDRSRSTSPSTQAGCLDQQQVRRIRLRARAPVLLEDVTGPAGPLNAGEMRICGEHRYAQIAEAPRLSQ